MASKLLNQNVGVGGLTCACVGASNIGQDTPCIKFYALGLTS